MREGGRAGETRNTNGAGFFCLFFLTRVWLCEKQKMNTDRLDGAQEREREREPYFDFSALPIGSHIHAQSFNARTRFGGGEDEQ